MVENNEIKEMKYTEEQVMNALLQLQPEERAFLYGVNIANIMELANNSEYVKETISNWTKLMNTATIATHALSNLVTTLYKQVHETKE